MVQHEASLDDRRLVSAWWLDTIGEAKYLGHSTPCGSSSGYGVGVAAGFAPISIGTESDGSLVQPATRAGLYLMKATTGAIDMAGSQAFSPWVASCGHKAKSVEDLANLMEVLLDSHQISMAI